MVAFDYKGRKLRKKTHRHYTDDPKSRSRDLTLCTEREHDVAYLTDKPEEVTCERCKAVMRGSTAVPRKAWSDRSLRMLSRDLASPLSDKERLAKHAPKMLTAIDSAIEHLLDIYNGEEPTIEHTQPLLFELIATSRRARGLKPLHTLPEEWTEDERTAED